MVKIAKISKKRVGEIQSPASLTENRNKRLRRIMLLVFFLFFALVIRIAYIEFVKGEEYTASMTAQLSTSRTISTKRGKIYDTTGKALALSAKVDTVTINPTLICVKNSDAAVAEAKTKELKEKVAKAFSDIFELDYEETLAKVNSTKSLETIARKQEKEKIDALKAWMEEEEYSTGINIDEDEKRYYPYGSLASSLLGFCGSDNQGLYGLEQKWDSILTGTPGRIITQTDSKQEFIPDKNEKYIEAENGCNLTLTIDANIQSICEKYLKQAVIDNDCEDGGTVIIMNPQTGDILAMVSYPDYNLNEPFVASDNLKSQYTNWDGLTEAEQTNAIQSTWKNRTISESYQPGSTFKIITAAIALEEEIAVTDEVAYNCIGYDMESGIRIGCWKAASHGYQTLRQALMNSCNPAFMQIGRKIGGETFYKYYDAFGLLAKTGIDTAGEEKGLFHNLSNLGPVELATMSFGQGITVTPLQLVTAVSAVANDGVLMQPRLVRQIENADTGIVTTIEPEEVRSVVSKETSEKMLDMLTSVVNDGTGTYGQVQGYSIAGKTGTSEPQGNDDAYVASFIGIAPSENPELVILVTLYNPKGKSHMGGQIAGPVFAQIASEVLPYLEIPTDSEAAQVTSVTETTSLPDVRNKTVSEAKQILEDAGFICSTSGSSDQIVTSQVPTQGTPLEKSAIIKLYTAESTATVSQSVPDLKGMTLAQAKNALKSKNLNISYTGTGKVISQDIPNGTSVEEGTVIHVNLQEATSELH